MREEVVSTAPTPEADLLTGAIASTHLAGSPDAFHAEENDTPETCADCGRDADTRGGDTPETCADCGRDAKTKG